VSARPLPGVQGGVVWALVAYDFRQPFVVCDRPEGARTYEGVADLAGAVRARDLPPELRLQVGAKLRPVLLLQDRPAGRLKEFAALKLTRVEKLDDATQSTVRNHAVERFFALPDNERFGLGRPFAVDLLSLVRVHESAIVGRPNGSLDENEFRVICERLVRVLDLDVGQLVVTEAAALLKRRGLI